MKTPAFAAKKRLKKPLSWYAQKTKHSRIRFALVCRSSDWYVQAAARQRPSFAFSAFRQWPAFAEKGCTPYLQHNAETDLHRVQVFHLIPLFSRTRLRVSPNGERSHNCHKNRSDIKFTLLTYSNLLKLSISFSLPLLQNPCLAIPPIFLAVFFFHRHFRISKKD